MKRTIHVMQAVSIRTNGGLCGDDDGSCEHRSRGTCTLFQADLANWGLAPRRCDQCKAAEQSDWSPWWEHPCGVDEWEYRRVNSRGDVQVIKQTIIGWEAKNLTIGAQRTLICMTRKEAEAWLA